MTAEQVSSRSTADVVLVSMPWDALNFPSIRIGILKAVLERAAVPTAARYFNLALMDHFVAANTGVPASEHLLVEHYYAVAERFTRRGVGEWIFGVPPLRELDDRRDEVYFEHLREGGWFPEELLPRIQRMRTLVPAFLESCADDILSTGARVVGFTTSFSQNCSSLALARILKTRSPGIQIVFGGANCDGAMGEALFAAFPWLDVIVRGEAEQIIVPLVQDLLAGGPIRPQPGLCYREAGRSVVVPMSTALAPRMDDVPLPDYEEYFERLGASRFAAELMPLVRLPIESARGCWWGEKSHCTFCALNGQTMKFRSKTASQVVEQIQTLARRFRWLDFTAVDNIIDIEYFRTFLPLLRDSGLDVRLFYETKSNLKKHQVRLMRDAGVRTIQPGIESLSTAILKLMKKGVSAIQNVRLLKWCAQFGIRVEWNLIYGFPREPVEDYARMADLMRSLTHLRPPTLGRLLIERFSPYFVSPERLGLGNLRPARHYGMLYDVPEAALSELAYDFDADHLDGRDPDSYVAPVRQAIDEWTAHAPTSAGRLRYRVGPGFMTIADRRTNLRPALYTLGEVDAHVYLACDAGARLDAICGGLAQRGLPVDRGRVSAILDELVANRLMMREDEKYLALALPTDPDADHVPVSAGDQERSPAQGRLERAADAPIRIRTTAA